MTEVATWEARGMICLRYCLVDTGVEGQIIAYLDSKKEALVNFLQHMTTQLGTEVH